MNQPGSLKFKSKVLALMIQKTVLLILLGLRGRGLGVARHNWNN